MLCVDCLTGNCCFPCSELILSLAPRIDITLSRLPLQESRSSEVKSATSVVLEKRHQKT
jgi:hypothetical protein